MGLSAAKLSRPALLSAWMRKPAGSGGAGSWRRVSRKRRRWMAVKTGSVSAQEKWVKTPRQERCGAATRRRASAGGFEVPDAEAAHAGVDFQVDGQAAVRGAAGGVEALDFAGVETVAIRSYSARADSSPGRSGAEHEDGPAGADFADFGGFGDVGDGEAVGPALHQARDGLREAVAVGVGLDHGDVADARRAGRRGFCRGCARGRRGQFPPSSDGAGWTRE